MIQLGRKLVKLLSFTKLHTRIVVFFATLIFFIQLYVLVITNSILSSSTLKEIETNLQSAEYLFNYVKEENDRNLLQTASILSTEYAFRKAVTTSDQTTILLALGNHGSQFGTDLMLLVGTDGSLIADTKGIFRQNQSFPFPGLIQSAQHEGVATGIVELNHQLYHVAIVPVLASTPIAWLVSGVLIDEKYARHLNSMTGLQVSFLSQDSRNGEWSAVATTLQADISKGVLITLGKTRKIPTTPAFRLESKGEEFLAHLVNLNSPPGHIQNFVLLQQSLETALGPLNELRMRLLWLSIASFIAALLASTWIARNITTPLAWLRNLAKSIEHGDYSQKLPVDREDELGQLATTFNLMSTGISERETRILELANRDPLTGLPNRALFNDRLDQAIKVAKRNDRQLAVMLMDLDRFKEVNDILGHHVGDQLLLDVARRLRRVVQREYDTVARLGGDEFAILLVDTDLEGAEIVAQNLLNSFDQPIFLEGQELIINASIGITSCPEHGENVPTLLRYADLAMYSAKQNKAGYAAFDPSLDWQNQSQLSLMAGLRRAIFDNELVLFYQPILSLSTRQVAHAEALVRWMHPERGLLQPETFIPFAEHTGFIKRITLWVIEEVIRQQKVWQNEGVDITVSINISARDLHIQDLPQIFEDFLEQHDVDPGKIILEITESGIMTDPKGALQLINELHGMKLGLAVDDFGTGYSSLAYLKKLPVQELKIDRSFVSLMETDEDDATIVRSTIELGHNMDLMVVAEGVENINTFRLLRDMGCDYIQGYYVSPPLPADELKEWLQSKHQFTVQSETA